MELRFKAEVSVTVEVRVSGESLEGLGAVVRFGGGESDADLEVTGARSSCSGLGVPATPRQAATPAPVLRS